MLPILLSEGVSAFLLARRGNKLTIADNTLGEMDIYEEFLYFFFHLLTCSPLTVLNVRLRFS